MNVLTRLSIATLLSASALAQPPTKSFLLADVHTSPFTAEPFMHGNSILDGRYFLSQATMLDLIATAYNVDPANVHGGPTWLERDRFDIRAKVPPHTTRDDINPMLRSLLADRFHLVVTTGTAPLPTYLLTAGPGKPKLAESEGGGEGACTPAPPPATPTPNAPNYITLNCKNMTMSALASVLHDFGNGYIDQPVADDTHLDAAYDFTLKWTWHDDLAKQGADGISLFTALDKQLGLKLELKTTPRPVFQVASVNETPTPNLPNIAQLLPEPAPTPFEVATIKPSKPDEQGFGRITGHQIETRAIPLMFLVTFGWNLNPNDKEAIANAPKWLDSAKFDVVAKAGDNVPVDHFASGNLINYEALQSMLRAMLTERFQMKWHMEDRPVTAYTLVAVKPHLKPTADPNERTRCTEGPGPDGKDPRTTNPILNRLLTCQNMTLAQIGDELQHVANGYIYNPVTDGTGIKGSYDFTLSFSSADKILPDTPDAPHNGQAAPPADPNGAVSVFDAISRQLGLRLEKTKRPYPVLVIDAMEETPTPN